MITAPCASKATKHHAAKEASMHIINVLMVGEDVWFVLSDAPITHGKNTTRGEGGKSGAEQSGVCCVFSGAGDAWRRRYDLT